MNKDPQSVFVTFGAGPYEPALARIQAEAESSGFFDSVIIKRPEDLGEDFWTNGMTPEKALETPRGYWAWRWKPRIILEQLESLPDGATLTYADAGCTINRRGAQRFSEYRQRALNTEQGMTVFGLDPGSRGEGQWTNGDVFAHYSAGHLRHTGQIIGGISVITKTQCSLDIVREWKHALEDLNLGDDNAGSTRFPEFVDHRHDQSVFSILCKLSGVVPLGDETWAPIWGAGRSLALPIWATRYRQ